MTGRRRPPARFAVLALACLFAASLEGQPAQTPPPEIVGDYDRAPRPLKITRPLYPQEAFTKKIEGVVELEIFIDTAGRVVRARVKSIPAQDKAALATVYQWVFEPAVKNGRPVATRANAPITFRIFVKELKKRKEAPRSANGIPYPSVKPGKVADDYHGTRVADPYRWLEDLQSGKTKGFIDAQNTVSSKLLGAIPERDANRKRLEELWNYPRTGLPLREAGRLFYRKNSGLEKQAPLYVRDGLEGPPQLLLDPNALSPDGSVALAQWAVSPDGQHLAYGLSPGGADWQTVHVRAIATGRELDERIEWFRFSQVSWTKDGKGFFYSRYPEPAKGQELSAPLEHQKLYYHRLGTPQGQDQLIYERPDLSKHFLVGGTTEDGRYLLVYLFEGTSPKNRLYYADLQDPLQPKLDAPILKIVDEHVAEFTVLGNVGPVFYARTDLDARLRVGRAGWKTIVPERREPLEETSLVGGRLFAQYLVDVKSQVEQFSLEGVTTADHDDRVVPSHSYKFTAALQAAQGCDRPVILHVETQGSHGYSPTDKLIAERADLITFVAGQLGLRVRAPGVAAARP